MQNSKEKLERVKPEINKHKILQENCKKEKI
jgi:hypothetical protein